MDPRLDSTRRVLTWLNPRAGGFFAWDDYIRPRQDHYFGGQHVLGGLENDGYYDHARGDYCGGHHGVGLEMDDDDAAYLFDDHTPAAAVRLHWQHVTVPKKQKKKPQRVQVGAFLRQQQQQQQQAKQKASKHKSTAARSSLGTKSKTVKAELYEVDLKTCKCGGGRRRHLGTITID